MKTYSVTVESKYTRSRYIRDVEARTIGGAKFAAIQEVIRTRGGWPTDYRVIGYCIVSGGR